MILDLTRLQTEQTNSIDINEVITFGPEELKTTDIRSINPVTVTGNISQNDAGIYHLYLNINGEMILPCAITLEDVPFTFAITYDEDIADDNENLKIIGNNLDIIPIVWENIITEIPIRVISPTATEIKGGDGWQLITDDEDNKPLSGLNDLLKEKEDE